MRVLRLTEDCAQKSARSRLKYVLASVSVAFAVGMIAYEWFLVTVGKASQVEGLWDECKDNIRILPLLYVCFYWLYLVFRCCVWRKTQRLPRRTWCVLGGCLAFSLLWMANADIFLERAADFVIAQRTVKTSADMNVTRLLSLSGSLRNCQRILTLLCYLPFLLPIRYLCAASRKIFVVVASGSLLLNVFAAYVLICMVFQQGGVRQRMADYRRLHGGKMDARDLALAYYDGVHSLVQRNGSFPASEFGFQVGCTSNLVALTTRLSRDESRKAGTVNPSRVFFLESRNFAVTWDQDGNGICTNVAIQYNGQPLMLDRDGNGVLSCHARADSTGFSCSSHEQGANGGMHDE